MYFLQQPLSFDLIKPFNSCCENSRIVVQNKFKIVLALNRVVSDPIILGAGHEQCKIFNIVYFGDSFLKPIWMKLNIRINSHFHV